MGQHAVFAHAMTEPERSENAVVDGSDSSSSARITTILACALAAVAMFYFWQIRNEGHLTAESGIGYWLGIAGVAATFLLLTYPSRKRLRLMRNWGSVAVWFRIHMFLGVLAPVLILVHSNFALGSLNSSIALFSMVIVSASGVIGRYIYTKIHYGLYGARATLAELRSIVEDDTHRVAMALSVSPSLQPKLVAFAETSLTPSSNVVDAVGRILFIGLRIRWTRLTSFRTLARALKKEARRSGWTRSRRRREIHEARLFVTGFLASVRKTVQFTFFERLFALWHVLHIPLFFMLVLATCAHIFAVHMY